MKDLFRPLLFSLTLLTSSAVAESHSFAAVQMADGQRIAAILAGDMTKLGTLLSNDLRYAQADGRIQTKAQFVAAAGENKVHYVSVVPRDLTFLAIAPGAVSMDGIAELMVTANGERVTYALRFLAVWREEAGQWRLLAYQSAQLPTTR